MLGVIHQPFIQLILCCHECNEHVHFFDFFPDFIGIFLKIFDFGGKIICGCHMT